MYKGAARAGTLLALLAIPAPALAGPEPVQAAKSLVRGPLRMVGDVAGGVGLCLARGVALVADGVSWIDANRWTRPVLHGGLSRVGHYAALGISRGSTDLLELRRGEDIERLPEHKATYLKAAPGYGRWTTFATGLSALQLGVGDGLATVPLVVLYASGASHWADALERNREEARIRALGPLALEPAEASPVPATPGAVPK